MAQLTYEDYRAQKKGTAIAKRHLTILLDNVKSPENVGMIFRLADALGCEGLVLTGNTPKPPHRRINQAARGALKNVDYQYFSENTEGVTFYKNAGYTIIALELTDNSVDLKSLDYAELGKILLVAGAENTGVSAPILANADYTVHIPMHGACLSMNVATSLAIAVYEILG